MMFQRKSLSWGGGVSLIRASCMFSNHCGFGLRANTCTVYSNCNENLAIRINSFVDDAEEFASKKSERSLQCRKYPQWPVMLA